MQKIKSYALFSKSDVFFMFPFKIDSDYLQAVHFPFQPTTPTTSLLHEVRTLERRREKADRAKVKREERKRGKEKRKRNKGEEAKNKEPNSRWAPASDFASGARQQAGTR